MAADQQPRETNEPGGVGYPSQIEARSVWQGDELTAREDWMHQLQVEEVDCLTLAGENLSGHPPEHEVDLAVDLKPLAGRLQRIQNDLEHGSGATLVRGFPLESLSNSQAGGLFWSLCKATRIPRFANRLREQTL